MRAYHFNPKRHEVLSFSDPLFCRYDGELALFLKDWAPSDVPLDVWSRSQSAGLLDLCLPEQRKYGQIPPNGSNGWTDYRVFLRPIFLWCVFPLHVMTQRSERTGVSLRTLQRFEELDVVPPSRSSTLARVHKVLLDAGIEFIGTPDDGPGIRLRRPNSQN